METERFSAVILGAGQAGGRAAKTMRDAGFEGSITLIGAEAHMPYERPPLSKDFLHASAAQPSYVIDARYAEEHGVTLRLGCSAVAIDRERRRVSLDDGSDVAYDGLLIATGARVRRLAIPGYPPDDLHYLRTLDDARRLEADLAPGRRVVIIGGGFIGLEVAASAQSRGCRVVVLEAADRLLPRLGSADASEHVLQHHLRSGIDVRLGVRIVGSHFRRLHLADGSEVDSDLVVAGVGVTPNDDIAAAAGLATEDGILTDEYGRTCDPHILAAGDVTRQLNAALGRRVRLESWQNANLQAEVAALTLIGVPALRPEPPWVWSDQGSLNLQVAGAPDQIDRVIVRRDPDDESATIFQFHVGRLVGGITLNRTKEMPLIRRVLADPSASFEIEMLADVATPLRRAIHSKVNA